MRKHNVKHLAKETTQSAQEQIDSLKSQLEQLLNGRINPALLVAAEKADHAVANAREIGHAQVEKVESRVRARPVPAMVISALIGFVLGRLSR